MALVKVKVKSLSRVQLFATPWTVAHQAPPSMGFSNQEYWSGLPFPSPGDLPDPGIKYQTQVSCTVGRCFNLWATREALVMALSEIKTNIQKWETKDEPQVNESYKIRQIIIKKWNIHTYIYTHEPSQNSPTKIKYNRLTQQTKEIKNYICQLRTKLTKAQTGKLN